MRVGINALFWIPNAMGGTQTYFLNLLNALLRIDQANEYVVFLNADGARKFSITAPNLRVHACPLPGRMRPLRLLWENAILPYYVAYSRLDLVHSLGYISPITLSTCSVATVLDMVHFIYPQEIDALKRLLWKILFPLSLKHVDRVISISKSVKRDITHFFSWAESKTVPIPLGVDRRLFHYVQPAEISSAGSSQPSPYILTVASASPHKNIGMLVHAFARISQTLPDLRLVLVGMKTESSKQLLQLGRKLSLDNRMYLVGRVSNRELVGLYQQAQMMVLPSRYEGFGLPLLEAMACGCPVIASDCSSIPEVVGDAAMLFNPEDVDQLLETILHVLRSEKTRAELVSQGLAHVGKYSWEATATKTLEVYRSCCHNTGLYGQS